MEHKYKPGNLSLVDICSSYSKGEDARLLFPSPVREQLLVAKETPAIGGVAGRDTAASIIVAFSKGLVHSVLPILTTEPSLSFVDYSIYVPNNEYLKKKIDREYDGILYDIVSIGDPEFWHVLNGRYVSETIKKLGFYSPCTACHLYFYVLRGILAKILGSNIVISGARDSHDGKSKVSQFPSSTELIQNFLREELGVTQFQPLLSIRDGKEIEEILGVEWEQGTKQIECLLAKNYMSVDGKRTLIEEQRVKEYLLEFAIPATKVIVQARLRGEKNIAALVQPLAQNVFG